MRKTISVILAALLPMGILALPVSALDSGAVVEQMTLDEKMSLLNGVDLWNTAGIERLDVPSLLMADGPHGIRKVNSDALAVCFPTMSLAACSWDRELLNRMGSAIGDAALEAGIDVALGPGINIKRSPLCGRNFEYLSEDPYITGALAAPYVQGLQSKGIGAAVKHYAVNNQETRRINIDALADERALREIYLPAFETVVKQADPWMLMSAYNRFEGIHCSESIRLQQDILRGEWGFKGATTSDWGGIRDRAQALKGGTDLGMPYSYGVDEKSLANGLLDGIITESDVDAGAKRIVELAEKTKNKGTMELDFDGQHELSREIAAQSIVLLKNDDNILPLKAGQNIAVAGIFAEEPRIQGAGSSLINNPYQIDNALDALKASGANVSYSKGFSLTPLLGKVADPVLRSQAVKAAKKADVALLFIGLPAAADGEGADRTHMNLPDNQIRLIEEVSAANPNTVVVYSGGSSVVTPWLSGVKGMLCAYLGGEAVGGAVADILTGKVNPSGKLTETWPLAKEDVACDKYFPGNPKTSEYRDSIFVGYRYYDSFGVKVNFPFGFGLSYTSFDYSDLAVSGDTVTFTVKNTGTVAGAEIAQLYIGKNKDSTAFRPDKELKGFSKVYLEPGQSKTVTIELDKRSFAFYNTSMNDWCIETGEYEILVGASSRDIRLRKTVARQGVSAGKIPDSRDIAPAYYGLNGQTPADVPTEQFVAVLGRPLPKDRLEIGDPVTMVDSVEDSLSIHPRAQMIFDFINPLLVFIFSLTDNPGYLLVLMQAPMFLFTSMTVGVLNEQAVEGFRRVLNGDWYGLIIILQTIPNIISNLGNLADMF